MMTKTRSSARKPPNTIQPHLMFFMFCCLSESAHLSIE
jgi:hypothetical protein